MPRSFDISQYAPNFSPLIDPLFNGGNINLPDMATIIADAIEAFFNDIVQAVDQYTGLDLSVFLPFVDTALTSLATLFGELDPASSTFDPVAAVITFLQLIADSGSQLPSALLTELIALWGSAASSDITNLISTFTGGGADFFNVDPATFDPFAAAEQVVGNLVPAGALSTLTQIPAHLFGNLTPGIAAINLLPDGGFSNPTSLVGNSQWSWDGTVDHTGVTGSGSAKTVGVGALRQLEGVPISIGTGGSTSLSTYVRWSGVTASGQSIALAVNAYNASGGSVPDPTNRLIQVIVNPGSGSAGFSGTDPLTGQTISAGSDGWVQLSGTYQAPAGAASVRMCLEVESTVTAGSVNFDDCVMTLVSGVVDASLLSNIENIPQIFGASVQGAQGIQDVISTFGHLIDGLGSAFGSLDSGLSFSQLFGLAQSTSQDAATAQTQAQAVATTQAIVINQPISAGLEATVESNIRLPDLGTGAAPASITVTQAVSRGSFVRLSQAKTLGFLQWMGYVSSGTLSGFYLNFAKIDTSGNLSPIFSSTDQHTLLNTALGWQLYDLTTLIGVQPGDAIAVEFQAVGTGTYTIAGLSQSWLTSHPSADTKQTGFTRNTGSSGPTSLSVSAASIGWNGNAPMIGLGVGSANIPPPVRASVPVSHTVHGSYTDTAPFWWRSGVDYLDRIALGSGGGGDSGYGGAGSTGTNTTITVGGNTLTALAAPGANSGGAFNVGAANAVGQGPSPNPYVYNGVSYYGGPSVGPNATGGSPGGGGGGGTYYGGEYGQGAAGGSWAANTSQPTATTVTSTVGTGGAGQSTFNAGSGADGAVWLVWRQNTSL